MKTVADLFANSHVVLGKSAQSDRHFVHVERFPGDTPDTPAIWMKSVEPGQLQNEYWVAREKNLLMLLKKLPQVVRLRKDDDSGDSAYHTVRTRDAGITLENWLKLKPQHIASGHSLEHPFAQVGSFLRLARGLLTALKALHREGVVHANIEAGNICLPYQPAPFRFDGGIRPDYANVCLIDFMFAVSSTLRLYRPLAVMPLAPPSLHSAQFRAALEQDQAAQRAEAIQDIDYSVDLYALGHLLEDIFQRGLNYPGNMQSQMEMTIYNLIHELLGFDDGIPDGVTEKYGSTLPHDIYIKRIDNMLALDPNVSHDDHDMLLLDPGQPLHDDAADDTAAALTEPHQPAPENPDLHGDPLLMSASIPDTTDEPAVAAPLPATSYFEINKWLVVSLLVLAQVINFIYHDGHAIHLDVVLSILLVLAVAAGLLAALLLIAPKGSLLHFVQGAEHSMLAEISAESFAPPSLRDDEYIHVSPIVVLAIIISLQLCGLFYAHGEGMGLDVMASILATLAIGLGLAAAKFGYDRFVTPPPLTVIPDDDEDREDDLPVMQAAAEAPVTAAETLAPAAPEPELIAEPAAAWAEPETETGAEVPATVESASGTDTESDTPPPAQRHDILAAAAVIPVVAAAYPVIDEAPAAQPDDLPVMDTVAVAEEAPVAVPDAPVAEAIDTPPTAPVSALPSTTAANDAVPGLAAAARTAHDHTPATLEADADAAAVKHLELDNRIVIVAVLLLLLLFFYLSKPDSEQVAEAIAAAPAPEIEAPLTEEPGLPEAVPALEADPVVSMPADTAALDDLASAPAPAAVTPRPAKAVAAAPARPAQVAPEPVAAVASTPVQPAATRTATTKPAKPVKTAKAAKPVAGADAAAEPVDEVTTAASDTVTTAAETAAAPAEAKPADVKPVTAVLTGTAPLPAPKPLGNSLAQAQNIMGWHYYKGINVAKDHPEALRWFRKAAQMGDASGQFNLGMMYANGYGTAKNQQEAARWFKMAADQGKANAQLNLGLMHLSGRGVEQNTAEGLRLLRQSAEAGDKNAQANLDALARGSKPLAATP